MIATLWGILLTWVNNISTIQIGLFVFASILFFVVFVRIVIAWWQKRDIERIPDYIEKKSGGRLRRR